eukprot:1878301-Pyramimonas_sp.AAC.1
MTSVYYRPPSRTIHSDFTRRCPSNPLRQGDSDCRALAEYTDSGKAISEMLDSTDKRLLVCQVVSGLRNSQGLLVQERRKSRAVSAVRFRL